MVHEWERFIWWLNQNSGAAQSIIGFGVAILTGLLFAKTKRYVALTHDLAKTAQEQYALSHRQFVLSQRQFAAAHTPQLSIGVKFASASNSTVLVYYGNNGDRDLRLVSARIQAATNHGGTIDAPLDTAVGFVMNPMQQKTVYNEASYEIPSQFFDDELSGLSQGEISRRLTVELVVSDVADLVRYRCSFNGSWGYKVEVLDTPS